jgi:transglutaminase-like putative cysteine protease
MLAMLLPIIDVFSSRSPFVRWAGRSLVNCSLIAGYLAMVLAASGPLFGQESDGQSDTDSALLKYVAPKVIEMQIGLRIEPGDGNMVETQAQTVFPMDWPEQKVQILGYSVPSLLNYTFRDLPGNNRQLLFYSPLIHPGPPIEAIFRLSIEKSHIVGPDPSETETLVIPRRSASKLKQFMGTSPYIDPNLGEIKRVVREIDATNPPTVWARIERLYDWVRDNIQYENGEIKSVQQALKDRTGDCEEMTGIFIALCRAARVPARCVWIPNHCYPEFCLEDAQGEPHWFPCQVAGTRNFGNMPEYLPILQKGDRFKVPERKETQRYLADYLSSKTVTGQRRPKVVFIRNLLDDFDQHDANTIQQNTIQPVAVPDSVDRPRPTSGREGAVAGE